MNETIQQIANACVPVLCLLITAGGAYLVALFRKKTDLLKQEVDNDNAAKYIDIACEAVTQAVTYTAQTYVDALKKEGVFDAEKQAEAFEIARDAAMDIMGDAVLEALTEIYGDTDKWLDTKIEQVCREIKASKEE